MITVERVSNKTYNVTVVGSTTTQHKVTVNPSYHEKLTGGRVAPEILIERSFEFLLERESNSSILQTFDLPIIGRYFPDYERTIQAMLE
ncbi:MAG: hypothetical protein O7F16_05485 [Acidobacteria bacterium]|nr:hypothetical protein [Acidobacteriota bacterium]